MPDIYRYTDFREFLRDYFAEEKERRPGFSHQYFAQRAGIGSTGFVLHVIKGERNLTRPVTLKIARAMGLSHSQTEYLEDLVSFGQAKGQSDREFYFDRVCEKRKKVKAKPLDDRQHEFYSAWYHPVVRELVALTGGNADPSALARALRPSVSAKQVKKSLQLQEELGLLKRRKAGGYEVADPVVAAGGPVRNTALVRYQKEMLGHALEAWDRFAPEEMSMHTVTVAMPELLVEKVRQEIRDFKQRLLELAARETAGPQRVFHLNVNLFPVSRAIEEKKA